VPCRSQACILNKLSSSCWQLRGTEALSVTLEPLTESGGLVYSLWVLRAGMQLRQELGTQSY
jgi:hypothetical protein